MTPVFLVSPMNRSGTHFLRELLIRHPAISRGPCPEDYLLAYSGNWLEALDSMSKHWWDPEDDAPDRFLEHLRGMLLKFFSQKDNQYLLLITPRPWGVENAFRLFPEARIIFLIRDGRDTVASACNSFPYQGFRGWTREWRSGVDKVIEFADEYAQARGISWELASFEELFGQQREALQRLFSFLQLSADECSWEADAAVPILGSGFEQGNKADLHWKPITRPDGFNPIGRFQSWPFYKRVYFNWVAGRQNKSLARHNRQLVRRRRDYPKR